MVRLGIVLGALLLPLAASAEEAVLVRLAAPEGEAASLAPKLSPAAQRRLKADVAEMAEAALATDNPKVDIALNRCLKESTMILDLGRTQPLIACLKTAVDGLQRLLPLPTPGP